MSLRDWDKMFIVASCSCCLAIGIGLGIFIQHYVEHTLAPVADTLKGEKQLRQYSKDYTPPEVYDRMIFCAIADNWPVFIYASKNKDNLWIDAQTGEIIDYFPELLIDDPFTNF